MSLIDRINGWIVERLHGGPTAISSDRNGLDWQAGGEPQHLDWARIAAIAAVARGDGLERRFALVFAIDGGGVLEIDETMPGWDALVDRLPAHLPLAASAPVWRATLAAGEPSLTLFERDGRPGQAARRRSG